MHFYISAFINEIYLAHGMCKYNYAILTVVSHQKLAVLYIYCTEKIKFLHRILFSLHLTQLRNTSRKNDKQKMKSKETM
jgi:hypothetical protein